jgi:hypothetical protein
MADRCNVCDGEFRVGDVVKIRESEMHRTNWYPIGDVRDGHPNRFTIHSVYPQCDKGYISLKEVNRRHGGEFQSPVELYERCL